MKKTTVVNIRKSQYDVYCGRAGHGQSGHFGNPFNEYDRETNIRMFKTYFYKRIEKDEEFLRRVLELKGKILGCFCKPKDCHCDIIAEFLNNIDENCECGCSECNCGRRE